MASRNTNNSLSGQKIIKWDEAWNTLYDKNDEQKEDEQTTSEQPVQLATTHARREPTPPPNPVSLKDLTKFVHSRVREYRTYDDLKKFAKKGNYMVKHYKKVMSHIRVLMLDHPDMVVRSAEDLSLSTRTSKVIAVDIQEFIEGTININVILSQIQYIL